MPTACSEAVHGTGADLVDRGGQPRTDPSRDLEKSSAWNTPRPASPNTGSSTRATQKITVLTLDGDSYAVHGEFAPGEQATSRLLPGFAVAVAETFAAKP